MNEEHQQNETKFVDPGLPEKLSQQRAEEPKMSEVSTLLNIFFEPGRTFDDLRKKPRFVIGFIIIALLSTAFVLVFNAKMGEERMRGAIMAAASKNEQFEKLPNAQKQAAVDVQMKISKYTSYFVGVFIAIAFLLGALIYMLLTAAFGGKIKFSQALSVWVYSSFPPSVVSMIGNFIVLMLKSPDDIDILASQKGLLQANPSILISGSQMPVLATVLSNFDLFVIWGLILAAIGLQRVGKISKGASWAIVIGINLLFLALRVVGALFSGNPS
ncbi:MAG: Yip1 family protein [Pyrinomonadaceae bacterium]